MSIVNFIIIDSSYLVRKGLAAIVEKIDKTWVDKSLNSINELSNELKKRSVDIVIINCEMVNEHEKQIQQIIIEYPSINWIITNTSKKIESKIISVDTININDEKNVIISKLEKHVKNKQKINKISQSDILSEREKNVLKLVAKGLLNKQIADELFISTHTVITHRKNITNKLGIKSVSGLTVYAILNKLVNFRDIN